jgi:hypothetical protein
VKPKSVFTLFTQPMTREEQLQFCRQCVNRRFDAEHGLVCALTGEVAAFETECPDFSEDGNVRIQEENGRFVAPFSELRGEQNLPLGLTAGIIVGSFGAILWGVITVATGFQIGYMALAIGFGVGLAIRQMGKGIDQIFGISGAIIALSSCLLGNFLSVIGFLANQENLGYIETLFLFDYSYLPDVMIETFSFIDLVFYAIAVAQGYKFSFRKIGKE